MDPKEKRGFAPIIIVLAVAAALAFAGGIYYLRRKQSEPQGIASVPIATTPASSTLELPIFTARQSSTNAFVGLNAPSSTASNVGTLPPDWKTLTVEKYKFQFSYPTDGWILMTTKSNENPSSLYQPLYMEDFYNNRTGQDDGADLVVAVYERGVIPSLTQWVSGLVPNLKEISEGDIFQALAKAYAKGREIYMRASFPGYSPPPDEIVTHLESESDGEMLAELGSITSGGGRLSYITWLTRKTSNYIYAVELRLQYAEAEATPLTDQEIIAIYKQMLSSVIVTD